MRQRRKYARHNSKEEKTLIKILLIFCALAVGLYGLIAFIKVAQPYLPYIGGLLVAAGLLIGLRCVYQRTKHRAKDNKLESDIQGCLRDMNTLSRRFKDENEGNRELAAMLRALGHRADLQPSIGNQEQADITVGNTIIEGKLCPRTTDIDRLHGQTIRYLKKFDRLIIVIFGELKIELEDRIQRDIIGNDSNKISLVSLNRVLRKR